MSWRSEVKTQAGGDWQASPMRFATQQEAIDQVADLRERWPLVVDTRVIESDDEVTHRWRMGALLPIIKRPKD